MKKKVTVVLPDKRRGPVEIESSASIESIKKTIVKDLDLGVPEKFILAVATGNEELMVGKIELSDGDFIFIINLEDTQEPVVKWLETFKK